MFCLIGPSGSGKTTFLRCINHLEQIDAGRIWVDGELVGYRQVGDKLHELRDSRDRRQRAEIGMVFQHFNLFPHMTALENVTLAPGSVLDRSGDEAAASGRPSCSTRVGLADKVDAYPSSSPAASSSASRSPARSRWSRS